MKIHRISDRELENLKIPIQKYEEDSGFKDFKMKAQEILGEKSFSCMKYLFMIYILIDLYSLKSPDRKNIIVKTMERYGFNKKTIEKIDGSLKLGLSTGYILLLYLNKMINKKKKV